jgi:hypothetical protein
VCQRSPETSQSKCVSSHFHFKKLPLTLCYGAFSNENAHFVYEKQVAGLIRPLVAGFEVTGDSK